MPKIKLDSGVIKYKTVPLYLGVKRIDKAKSFENLLVLKRVFERNNIKYQLAFGTLLGAIRDKDFISHDEDIDLAFLSEDKTNVLNILPQLIAEGFIVARYDRKGLISVIRNDEYTDFYFFKPYRDGFRSCSGIICPSTFLENTTMIDFKGTIFPVPIDYVNFFRYQYGEDWETPIQYANYELSNFHRFEQNLKLRIKDLLPDFIYFRLAKIAEKKMLNKYTPKMEKYLKEQKGTCLSNNKG
jgi:hypothetical protein